MGAAEQPHMDLFIKISLFVFEIFVNHDVPLFDSTLLRPFSVVLPATIGMMHDLVAVIGAVKQASGRRSAHAVARNDDEVNNRRTW